MRKHQVAYLSCGRNNETMVFMRCTKCIRDRFQDLVIREVWIARLNSIQLVCRS